MGHEQHVPLGEHRGDARQDAVGTLAHLPGRFARVPVRTGRRPVRPQAPIGTGAVDLDGGNALVAAVLPLMQVRVHHRPRQAREFSGAHRATERAGQDEREGPARQKWSEGLGLFLAAPGEGQVGPAGVLTRRAPLGLAVADQEKVAHDRYIAYFADSTEWPPN